VVTFNPSHNPSQPARKDGITNNIGETAMKHKLLIALLSLALIPAASFAAKPVKIPEPGQAVWVDANGTMIGDVQAGRGTFFEVNGKFYITSMNVYLFYPEPRPPITSSYQLDRLFYDKLGCTGNVFASKSATDFGYVEPKGSREGVLYIEDGDIPQRVEVLSGWSEGAGSLYDYGCTDIPQVWDVYPVVPFIDTNIYTLPFRLKLTPSK
jgi:hypothetical protein